MAIKEKDFVEIEYVGKIKETGQIFDTTDKELAKANQIHQEGFKYGPRVVCVGEHEILKGIDDALIGKNSGEKLNLDLKAEEAFGARNSEYVKTVPTDVLLKQNIQPYPGLQITTASGLIGYVRTVTRGRTLVDFNHPLAGKEMVYDITIKSIVTDNNKKLVNFFENAFRLAANQYTIAYQGNVATITLKGVKFPKELQEAFVKKAKEAIPELEVKFAQ